MSHISHDDRTQERRVFDDAIANEVKLPIPDHIEGYPRSSMEDHLEKIGRPVAMLGVVENGLIRLLDPSVSLSEHSRVIVVASQNS